MPKKNVNARHTRKLQNKRFGILAWILTGIIAIGAIGGTAIALRAHNSDHNETVLKLTVNQPGVTEFTDDNTTSFSGNIPDANNNRELSSIQPLIVSYDWISGPYTNAFRMGADIADIAKYVKITPFIRGKWQIRGQNSLMFIPDTAWPADQKFTVNISKNLINPDVDVDSRKIHFTTPDISAKIESFNIYPDSAAPKYMIGIAIVSFNYPVDTTDFADKVSMRLDGNNLKFYTKFDKFHRTAFIISENVPVTDVPQIMRLKINKINAAMGDARTDKITGNVTIESADNFFKISNIETAVADDVDGNAQQLILINTTAAAARGTKWSNFLDAYLLPKNIVGEQNEKSHAWANDEITDAVLKESKKLSLREMDFENPTGVHQYAFSYDVSDDADRYIYVRIRDGIKSAGDFVLQNGLGRVMRVPYPNATVKIAGSGALLSLAGDKKLGIMARGGITTAYVNLYKVKSSEINHLISQTYNVFASNMEFKSWSFGVYDMSVVFQKKISFADTSKKKTNYASVDLGDYLDRTHGDKTGIFIVQTGNSESQANYNDKRLILLTDLGIIRKLNLDGSSVLFVSNLGAGTPAADVEISVLGRNGNAVWAGRTDNDGRADVPRLAWSEYKNAREPVAFVARRGDDVAFIPYNSYETRVEYSKFDIDGTYQAATVPMNAYLFTDRGIYRPGENIVIGGIVKNKSFKSLAGVPVKLTITDPRGREILERKFSLNADGMFDIKYDISAGASVGEYSVRMYSLNSNSKPQDMIGTAPFQVQEFVPDTMKISATISGATDTGWISPDNLITTVSLRNLFGTPAADRRICVQATLRPMEFTFPEYKDYTFTQNFISGTGLADGAAIREQTFHVELPDAETDAAGLATLPIKFDRTAPDGTYILTLNARGFEGASGKSVQTTVTARVSNAKYIFGYSANSDLSYVARNSARRVNIIALDHTAARIAATGMTMRLVRRENLTSLIKDYNGYYKYQSVTRDRIVSQSALDIPMGGTDITLDTTNPGTYFLQILDASERILANIEYFVAGQNNASMQSDTDAELKIKLNATQYAPGDDIEISITAPYAGTGLITIERDRVYAYKWFRTESTSAIEHIKMPAGCDGTGYVNVSFVRDINSRDIFTTPYAYAVAPMRADISGREIKIDLDAPDTVTDGKLDIKYSVNKSSRIMIFAVNDGILQVAKYRTPTPLGHFFQKAALQVETFQILSLLLPEYKILREFAKTGGGDYDAGESELAAPLTNPFTRKTNAPVAFYSGILDARANETGHTTFDIPEYFNGAIKIYAVAANINATGSAQTETKIQSPLIISATTPLAVAPSDKFEVNAVISNLSQNSDANPTVRTSARTTTNLEITGAKSAELSIPENAEKLWTFNVSAQNAPGNADITIDATLQNEHGHQIANRATTATLSVRPVTTFETKIETGILTDATKTIRKFHVDLYPEYSARNLYISANSSAMMRPLAEYLMHYDYECSEQLVSRTMPYVIASDDAILGTTTATSTAQINDTINELKNRQNDDGSFSLWAGMNAERGETNNANTANLTAYVAQFLTMARDAGFNIPQNMLTRALGYLRTYAGENIHTNDDAAAAAFAIYVITRNGYVTTGYIDLFEEYANKNIKNWESQIMGAYIASAYKMLKQSAKADDIMRKYKPGAKRTKFVYSGEFDNNVANDAIYAYLTNRYFDAVNPTSIPAMTEYINGGAYSSYTSAMVIMGLSGGTGKSGTALGNISVSADGNAITGDLQGDALVVKIPDTAAELTIKCPDCDKNAPLFYTVLQQGFPTTARASSNGMEIVREYYDATGNRITSAKIGDTVTVKIIARTRGNTDTVSNVVITDLLPGGFIPDAISGDMDFSEIREDRVLIFTTLTRTPREITYTATIGTAGVFQIPPITATSMYNPQINAVGAVGGKFTVSNAYDEQ